MVDNSLSNAIRKVPGPASGHFLTAPQDRFRHFPTGTTRAGRGVMVTRGPRWAQIRGWNRLVRSAEGLRRLRERARQLYELEGDWQRLRQYVLRGWRWHLGGLDGMVRWKGGVKRTWHHVLTHLGLKHPPG